MVKPITWRTINAPQANPAIALGVGANAFSRAGTGFGSVADRMQEGVARETEQLTNEHITAALRGEPLPPDSRVDPTVVQNAVQSQGKFKSDELSAIMTRTGQGIEQALGAKELSVFDEKFDTDQERVKAATDASIASTANSRSAVAAREKTQANQEASEKRMAEVEKRWATIASDNQAQQVAQKDEALTLLREKNPDMEDWEVEQVWNNVLLPDIQANAQAGRDKQALAFEADTISELGLTRPEWEATTPGSRIGSVQALTDAETAKRRSEGVKQHQFERKMAGEAAVGDYSKIILTGDQPRVVGTKAEAERNKISDTQNAAVSAAEASTRIVVKEQHKKLAHRALQLVGGNRQAFEQVLRAGVTTNYELIGQNFPQIKSAGWDKVLEAARISGNALRSAAADLQKNQATGTPGASSIENVIQKFSEERNDAIWRASPEGQAAIAAERAQKEEEARANEAFNYAAHYGQ